VLTAQTDARSWTIRFRERLERSMHYLSIYIFLQSNIIAKRGAMVRMVRTTMREVETLRIKNQYPYCMLLFYTQFTWLSLFRVLGSRVELLVMFLKRILPSWHR
jgi:hypothetical protein